jgi:hypothetical protein
MTNCAWRQSIRRRDYDSQCPSAEGAAGDATLRMKGTTSVTTMNASTAPERLASCWRPGSRSERIATCRGSTAWRTCPLFLWQPGWGQQRPERAVLLRFPRSPETRSRWCRRWRPWQTSCQTQSLRLRQASWFSSSLSPSRAALSEALVCGRADAPLRCCGNKPIGLEDNHTWKQFIDACIVGILFG